ncbi:hypothetical protein N0V90_012399 [Kalmusia sp. IMI 367209]|nr:hypothetical protein N0V90_012399 [Kalmusia sp. IMI 367209]
MVPTNFKLPQRELQTAENKYVVRPNADTLYTIVFVDLSVNDLEVTVPDFGDRFGVYPFYDAYGNNFASIGSNSNITHGKFRVCYDQDNIGVFSGGAEGYDGWVGMPTPYGLINMRIVTDNSTADLKVVHNLQDEMIVKDIPRSGPPVAPMLNLTAFQNSYFTGGNGTTQEEAVMHLTAAMAPFNQPEVAEDREWVAQALANAGIKNGVWTQPPGTNLTAASAAANQSVDTLLATPGYLDSLTNNWEIYDPRIMGDFHSYYQARYLIAVQFYIALTPDQAVYPMLAENENFESIASGKAVLFQFSAKPVLKEKSFWSLTAYGPDQFFIPNDLNRYALGDRSNLTYPDGSLVYSPDSSDENDGPFEILFQPSDIMPPQNWTSNWLPGPVGGGNVSFNLRWYGAEDDMIEGGSYVYPKLKMSTNISSITPNNGVAYVNGRIYTVNTTQPWASGFIVSPEGRFTLVGDDTEIRSASLVLGLVAVDLKQRFVMPGIHDAHMHMLYAGMMLTSDTNIGMETTSDNIADEIHKESCKCEYINARQDWIMAAMYSNPGFPNDVPDRKYLDEKFPGRPVVVLGGAGHSHLLNTEALKRAGYDLQNEVDVQAGVTFWREDGSLTGELGETAATKAVLTMPAPGLAHVKRVLKAAIHVAHKAGVTSYQEASANTLILHALRELDEENALRMNVATHIVHGPEFIAHESKSTLHPLIETAERFKSKHVDTRFVKIVLDGVPLAPLFSHCGLDSNNEPDKSKLMIEDAAEAILKYDSRGMTVKIHCTGHGATRMTLDAIESARTQNPKGPRHEIAHCSGVHDDEYPRFSKLNVTAEMSPADFFVHPVTAMSEGRMDWNFPKMLKAGAFLTIGSDWGATLDPSLFGPMAKIVDTVGSGNRLRGGEMLCRMLTIDGAEAVGKDREIGSIQVGKKANFIVVDRDLSKGEFDGAKVLRTFFEGECVWNGEV